MIIDGEGHKHCEFVLSKNDIIKGENFSNYIKKHGIERAVGYFEATQHIAAHLEEILGNIVKEGEPLFSIQKIKTNTILLHNCLQNFLIDHSTTSQSLFSNKPDNV